MLLKDLCHSSDSDTSLKVGIKCLMGIAIVFVTAIGILLVVRRKKQKNKLIKKETI